MSRFIFILYILVGFTPYFGASDKSAPQILYLQLVNIIAVLSFFYLVQKAKNKLKSIIDFNNIPFQLFFFFFIWASVSIFFAVNKVESLRILTEVYTYLLAFICLCFHLKNISKSFFVNTFLTLIGVELFMIILPFCIDLYTGGGYILRSNNYSGVAGNINITSFLLLVKIPFLIYTILDEKTKRLKRNLCYIILTFSIFSIFSILVTRGAILGVFVLFFILLFLLIRNHFLNNDSIKDTFLKTFKIIIAPMLIVFLLKGSLKIYTGQNASIIEKIVSVGAESDGSSQERIRYWKQSFGSILEHPIFGIGIGNWKLVGIDKEGVNMRNYIVPYHAHNDFLELMAETGIIGGITYFLIFLLLLYFLIKKILNTRKLQENLFLITLFLSISAYLIDSTLNFPFARPVQHILILSILVFCLYRLDFKLNFRILKKTNKLFLIQVVLLIFFIPVSLYSSIRLFKSSQEHFFLLTQFNTNTFTIPLTEIDEYDMEYPNISPTTIPLKTIKGIYYLKGDKFKKAAEFFKEGKKVNPYLQISNSYLGYSYHKMKQNDSALYYSSLAFEKHPLNMVHFAHFMISLSVKEDTLGLMNTYQRAQDAFGSSDPLVDKIYYLSMSGLLDKDEGNLVISNIRKSLFDSEDDQLKETLYVLEFGKEQVIKADLLHKEGLKFFDEKKYDKAAEKFYKAAILNPLELPYYENAANAYLQISNHEKTLEMVNYIIDNSKKPNGKAYYLKAIVYLEKENRILACEFLTQSKKLGFKGANNVYRSFCK